MLGTAQEVLLTLGETTSRETAWLHSIEAPVVRRGGAGPLPQRETEACLEAARALVDEARQVLADTRPDESSWARYLPS